MLGRIFLNSRKERRKDGVFLWDLEELTFLIIQKQGRKRSLDTPKKKIERREGEGERER